MRVAVLPRDVAARVITTGISRGAWALNCINLALAIPILVEFMLAHGLADALPVPLTLLGVMLAFALWAAIMPRAWLVATFLGIGALCAILYEVSLVSAYPTILSEGLFVANRPAVSLVLIGMITSTWVTGLTWTFVGFLVSTAVSLVVAAITGLPVATGLGPVLVMLIYVATYLALGAIQRSQRRLVPDFEQLESETQRLEVEANVRSRVTAAVHDTLLNDLSLIMNAPDALNQRVVDRLTADIETLTSAEWMRESQATAVDDSDAELRNRLMLMMSDLQWRGLTVHITGIGPGIYRLSVGTASALLDAIRACLENVLRHSGTAVAEVDIAYTPTDVTVVVSDQGVGFDPTHIAADRLGFRLSVIDRMHDAGGSARIWSSPGAGTSIVLAAPVLEMVAPHPESTHGQG